MKIKQLLWCSALCLAAGLGCAGETRIETKGLEKTIYYSEEPFTYPHVAEGTIGYKAKDLCARGYQKLESGFDGDNTYYWRIKCRP